MKEATIKKKAEKVDLLADKFQESKSLVFIDYLGLTVAEVSNLRNILYSEGCEMHVIKNNILRRAVKKVGYEGLDEVLVGPNAVALSKDATNTSRIIYDFLKTNKKLKVKLGVIEGKITNEDDLKVLAKLPNKDGMLSMLLSVLQAPIRKLAVAVKAVAEKQEA
ncbi:MAG: 50S ribosomal protein L10 [Bacilli bacterium]|nr:50S ribosomal protein L10 [Bacilli bacterium]MDD4077171.1 50S ribosomal protein L10 [Bacilli bacterium]MDD4387892.1 50S ribosomal protein L10 [Bacilli bacterium]